MIKEIYPPLPVQLYNGTWINLNPVPFLEDNNSIATLLNGGIWYGWSTTEEKSFENSPITFLNVYHKYPVYGSQYKGVVYQSNTYWDT